MHRRAILSDIHGNLPALEAVLADLATQEVDEIVCLGDLCGYGPQPVECIQRMREKAAWILLGNHDEALFKEPAEFSRNAYEAILWQRKIMDPALSPADQERWDWLQSLSPQRLEDNVLYVHASPRDPLHEYILKEEFDAASGGPTAEAKAIFEAFEWLCFCGHSHRPGVVAEDYKWWNPDELPNGRSMLRRGFKTIVNVGSVGQPRDGHPEACYVLFDVPKTCAPAAKQTVADKGEAFAAGTIVMPRSADQSSAIKGVSSVAGRDDETRSENDQVLQEARNTAIMRSPKVIFRRVPYDVADEQLRVFAVPELPRYNGVRLARGI